MTVKLSLLCFLLHFIVANGKVRSLGTATWASRSRNSDEIPTSPAKTLRNVNDVPKESATGIRVDLRAEDLSVDYTPKYCRCVSKQFCSGSNRILHERAINTPTCQDEMVMCCQIPRTGCGVVEAFPPFYPYPSYGEADYAEYPWTALVLDANSDTIFGTGVVISRNLVLTSARNIQEFGGKRLSVRLGEWDIASLVEPFEPQEFLVREIIAHPLFDPKTFQHDIALLRVNGSINLDVVPSIRAPCVARAGDDLKFANARCVSAGWAVRPDVKISTGRNIIKEVDLQIHDPNVCERAIRRSIGNPEYYWDDQSFLCAGGQQGKGLCKGDEGAALICQDRPGSRYTVIGIASWATTCGQGGFPVVFTNLASYYSWIKKAEPTFGE